MKNRHFFGGLVLEKVGGRGTSLGATIEVIRLGPVGLGSMAPVVGYRSR